MECNRDEASRAKEIAERKLTEKDYVGAKKFAMKAHNLYPRLDGISQFLATIDVYIFSENRINGEADYYGILGVNPLDSEDAIRKKYRKLVLMLHPDKNNAKGADGAFILLSQAWDLLSDKTKRLAYDKKVRLGGFQLNNQPQCGGSAEPPAQNGGSNMKVPKDNSKSVPVDSYGQHNPASTDPLSSFKEKPSSVNPPHKRVSSRKKKTSGKEKPPTVPPPHKHSPIHSPCKEKPPTVPPLNKHSSSPSSHKVKPAPVSPHKHETPSAVPPSSYNRKEDNTFISSDKERQPAVPSSHRNAPSTNLESSSKRKPAATPLSSHEERSQTISPTTGLASSHKCKSSSVHASFHEQKQPTVTVSSRKEKLSAGPPSHAHKPSRIPTSPHKQKPPTSPISINQKKPPTVVPCQKQKRGRGAASSNESSYEKESTRVHVASQKRKWAPNTPDPSQEPNQTAGNLSRCNGCKMQLEFPKPSKQSKICPNCGKLVFPVRKAC